MLTDDKIRPILRTIIGPMIVEEDMRCARAIAAAQHKKDIEAFDCELTKEYDRAQQYGRTDEAVTICDAMERLSVWLRQEGA